MMTMMMMMMMMMIMKDCVTVWCICYFRYYMPHGLTIDADDNMWLTDVGRHQVRHIVDI